MDRWLDFALWQTMRDLAPVWLPLVKEGKFDFGNVDHLVYALKAVESRDVVPPLLALLQKGALPADRVPAVLEMIATLGGPQELGAVFQLVVASDSPLFDTTLHYENATGLTNPVAMSSVATCEWAAVGRPVSKIPRTRKRATCAIGRSSLLGVGGSAQFN